ncbi:MAG: CPBP family glutamic-type intramembrane protease [Novosphingobium sp.]|nr:CPBP family glutamic-type intramembrane protease [Novosphingobium sp.]
MIRPLLTEFAAFLRHPRPMHATGLNADGAISRWLALSIVQIAVLGLVVMPLILAWKSAFGLPSPDAFEGLSPLALWGGAVLLGPVLEELFFRGWMSGRPAALWLMLAVMAGLALFAAFGRGKPLVAGAILLGTVVLSGIAWLRTRRDREVKAWFARGFPALFHGMTVLFALLHVFNYPQVSAVVLPMVLPQLWSGLMLGYIRVRLGLLASILAHVASNAVMLAAALATG